MLEIGGLLAQVGVPGTVFGAVPGIDCALGEAERLVGNDEVEVEVDCVAEALAARTCAEWIVEAEEARLGFCSGTMAVFALVGTGEAQSARLGSLFAQELLQR